MKATRTEILAAVGVALLMGTAIIQGSGCATYSMVEKERRKGESRRVLEAVALARDGGGAGVDLLELAEQGWWETFSKRPIRNSIVLIGEAALYAGAGVGLNKVAKSINKDDDQEDTGTNLPEDQQVSSTARVNAQGGSVNAKLGNCPSHVTINAGAGQSARHGTVNFECGAFEQERDRRTTNDETTETFRQTGR